MSAFARRSSSLATAVRFAAAVTHARIVVARSTSKITCCCSDRTTFDISAVKQSSTYCPFASES
eukprot:3376734-Pyramimonas_sp.AAC.1